MPGPPSVRQRWGFFLYDFANSGYVLVFGTFLFPLYVRQHLLADHPHPDLVWGASLSAAVLLAALLAPLIGLVADRLVRRTVLGVAVFGAAAGVSALAALSMAGVRSAALLLGLFVVTHALYVISVALCDSYLSHLGTPGERTGISSFGWGFGYLGGVVCLVGVLAVGGASVERAERGFALTALFFVAVAAVALGLLPRLVGTVRLGLRAMARRVVHRRLGWTLLAFWLINEGIVTILFFSALFGRETLGLDIPTIGAVFVAVQLIAFPATWLVGEVARRTGDTRAILGTVGIWCGLIVGLALARTAAHYVALSLGSALVIGSTQALMRAHYTRLYPEDSSGFSFGLYTLVAKSSTLVGPAAFGLVATLTGSQRWAVVAALVPLAAGGAVLGRITGRRR